MYWVYILENYLIHDYIGVTIDIEKRLIEHKINMLEAGVSTRRLKVAYHEYYTNAILALNREKELKALTSHKLNKLIQSNELVSI